MAASLQARRGADIRLRNYCTVLLPFVLLGCAGTPLSPLRLYEGPPRDGQTVARVVLDEAKKTQPLFGYWEWVELRKLDDKKLSSETNGKRVYEVLPGTHDLTVRYVYDASGAQGLVEALLTQSLRDRMTERFERVIPLDAKAGVDYVVKFRVEKESAMTPVWNWKLYYWIEDLATGAPDSADAR